jgi:ABC-type dipeptide/oligopeptide/nickel transport system ATPase component
VRSSNWLSKLRESIGGRCRTRFLKPGRRFSGFSTAGDSNASLLQDLRWQFGLALLFISHHPAIIAHITHCVAAMHLGKIVEMAGRQQIFTAPKHPYTQALLSAVPVPSRAPSATRSFSRATCRARSTRPADAASTPAVPMCSIAAGSRNRSCERPATGSGRHVILDAADRSVPAQ